MDLEPGETVIFEGHPSWRSVLDFYFKGLLAAAIAGGLAALASQISEDQIEASWIVVAVAVVLVLMVIAGWLKRLSTRYVITDRRLYIRRGIVAREEQQTQLSRIQNVNTTQTVVQRLLAVGTVDFDTAADESYDFQFAGVASPQQVVAAVHRAQEASQAV